MHSISLTNTQFQVTVSWYTALLYTLRSIGLLQPGNKGNWLLDYMVTKNVCNMNVQISIA